MIAMILAVIGQFDLVLKLHDVVGHTSMLHETPGHSEFCHMASNSTGGTTSQEVSVSFVQR
jgi:hypothetical protein